MPYQRKFYYIPRSTAGGSNGEVDVLLPFDSLKELGEPDCFQKKQSEVGSSSGKQAFGDLSSDEQMRQLKFKQILGILNKMTPKKFHKLILLISPEPLDLSYVKMLAQLIFSKVLDDEIYVHLYAKLCEELLSNMSQEESLECFKDVLRKLCKSAFDNILSLKDSDIADIDEEKRYIYKRRLMTVMRFIGELTCLREPLLSRQYCWDLTERLVDKGDELHLEAVYSLLFTFALRSDNNTWPEDLWVTIAGLSKGIGPKGETVSSRIRFMYLSLVEARVGVMRIEDVPQPNTPPTSDSEANEQMPDLKGF